MPVNTFHGDFGEVVWRMGPPHPALRVQHVEMIGFEAFFQGWLLPKDMAPPSPKYNQIAVLRSVFTHNGGDLRLIWGQQGRSFLPNGYSELPTNAFLEWNDTGLFSLLGMSVFWTFLATPWILSPSTQLGVFGLAFELTQKAVTAPSMHVSFSRILATILSIISGVDEPRAHPTQATPAFCGGRLPALGLTRAPLAPAGSTNAT